MNRLPSKKIHDAHIVTMCVLSAIYITYALMTITSLDALGIPELLTKLLAPLSNIVGSSFNTIITIAATIVGELMNLMSEIGEQVVTVILPILGNYIGKLWGIVLPYISLTGSAAWMARFIPNPKSKDSILSKLGLSKLLPKQEDIITFTTDILKSVNDGYNMVMSFTSSKGSQVDKLQHKIENTLLTSKKTVTKGLLDMKTYVESLHYRLYYMIYDQLYKFMEVAPYTPEDYRKWLLGTMRVFPKIKYTTARPTSLLSRKATTRKRLQKSMGVKPLQETVRRGTQKKRRGLPSRPVSRSVLKSRNPRLRRTLSTAMYPQSMEPMGYRSEGKKKK